MKFLHIRHALLLVALLIGVSAMANQALAVQKGCLSCHGIDRAKLGPAYKDVAAKYKGQKDAEVNLAKKLLNGGGGVWHMPMGPMPAQKGNISEDEAKLLAQWVLSLK